MNDHTNHAAESHLRQQQTSGNKGHTGGTDATLFKGRKADEMMVLVQGHGNILAESGATNNSSSSGSGDTSWTSHSTGQGHGPIAVNTATADSRKMTELVLGGNSTSITQKDSGWNWSR